jgi:hypothetical protein
MLLKLSTLVVGACYASVSDSTVSKVWDKTHSVLQSADESLSEVKEHAEEAIKRESKDVEDSRKHLHESADEL